MKLITCFEMEPSLARNSDVVKSINGLLAQLTKRKVTVTTKDLISTHKRGCIIVAECDNVIIGMGTLIRTPHLTNLDAAEIHDVIVDKEFQNQKIGKEIMRKLIEKAKELDVKVIGLTSNPSRERANIMYGSLGFVQKETNVWRMTLS